MMGFLHNSYGSNFLKVTWQTLVASVFLAPSLIVQGNKNINFIKDKDIKYQ